MHALTEYLPNWLFFFCFVFITAATQMTMICSLNEYPFVSLFPQGHLRSVFGKWRIKLCGWVCNLFSSGLYVI